MGTTDIDSKSLFRKVLETIDFLLSKWMLVAYHIALAILGVAVAIERFNTNLFPGLGISICLTLVCLIISCFITKPFHRLLDALIVKLGGEEYSGYYLDWIEKAENSICHRDTISRDWTRWEIPMVFAIPTIVLVYYCLNVCSGVAGQCWIINGSALPIGSSKIVPPFGNEVEMVNINQNVDLFITSRTATGEDVRATVAANLTLSKETSEWRENSMMKKRIAEDLNKKFGIIIGSMSLAELQDHLLVEKRLTNLKPPCGTRWSGPVSVTDMHIVPRSE